MTDTGSYELSIDGGSAYLEPYIEGMNVFIRWSIGAKEGLYGGLTENGEFAPNIHEYMMQGGTSDTYDLPDKAFKEIAEEIKSLRESIIKDASTKEKEAIEKHREILKRARQKLREKDTPTVSEYEVYDFQRESTIGEVHSIKIGVEPRNGVAELRVETPAITGYSPKYDLNKNNLTLPPNEWGMTTEIEIPSDIASNLMDDLISLQEELNDKRDAYNEAVKEARKEITETN